MKKRAPRKQKPRRAPSGRSSGHVNVNGTPKTGYASQAEAQRAANQAWLEHRIELTSYLCELCNRWHNGKPFGGEQFN